MAVSVRCACGRVDVFTCDDLRIGWTLGAEGPLCPGCTRFAATNTNPTNEGAEEPLVHAGDNHK
jgi:hypothetical protein